MKFRPAGTAHAMMLGLAMIQRPDRPRPVARDRLLGSPVVSFCSVVPFRRQSTHLNHH